MLFGVYKVYGLWPEYGKDFLSMDFSDMKWARSLWMLNPWFLFILCGIILMFKYICSQ